MKTEDQVCTLEQAKKLNELGIISESEFYFRGIQVWHFREVTDWPNQEELKDLIASGDESAHIISAFTVSELGIMLPTGFDTVRITGQSDTHVWMGYDYNGNGCPPEEDKVYQTEAQARAAMLIYLLESNLITPEQVNQSLKQ